MKKTGRIIALVLLVVVIAVSVSVYLSNNGYFDMQGMTSLTLDASTENIVMRTEDGFVLYSGKQLFGYDASLVQHWATETAFEDAYIETNENYTLLYKDKDLALYNGGVLQITLGLENNIKYASVNKNGYITVVSEEKGYRGKCVVYDRSGEEVFRYFSGDNYIVQARLSPNNLVLAVNMLFLGGTDAVSILTFVDVNTGDAFNEHVFTDNLVSDVSFIRSNQAIALGDRYLLSFTAKGKERWRYDYDGQTPEKIMCSDGIIAILSRGQNGFGRSALDTFDYAGRKKGTYYNDTTIEYMDTSGGYVAITSGQDITMLNKKGEIVGCAVTASPITDILLYENKNRVTVLSNGYLRSEKLDR